MAGKKVRHMKRKVNRILLFVSIVLSMFAMTKTVYAASSSSSKYINSSWVKTGSGYAKKDETTRALYCKNSRGVLRKVSKRIGIAVGEEDVIYYNEWKSDYSCVIYSYNIKTGAKKKICAPYHCHNYLGYYKGYIYYSVGEYYRETLKTYKQSVKTGKRSRITTLNGAGDACQYKNYMAVMNVRGDPGPTTMRIYNLSTGKVVKTISWCTAVKIIKGMIYYSVYSGSVSSGMQKIYRCSMNGTKAKKIATYKGSNLMPGIECSYAYFVTRSGKIVKYYYSSKKTVSSSQSAYTKSWQNSIVY